MLHSRRRFSTDTLAWSNHDPPFRTPQDTFMIKRLLAAPEKS